MPTYRELVVTATFPARLVPRGEPEPLTQPRVALAALIAVQFMVVVDATIVNVALPSIRNDLGLSASQTSWVVDGYLVAFGGLLLLGGRLADLLPRRAVLLTGLTAFVAASVVCGLAPQGAVLVAARVVQGLGAALLAPAALSLLVAVFPRGAGRARAMGLWGSASGAGSIAGVLLGGLLSQSVGWAWIFWINVPVGVLVAVGAVLALPATPRRRGSFDLAGAVTVTVAAAALAIGLVDGASAGWARPTPVVAGAVGMASLGAFLLIERRTSSPLVPLEVVRRGPLLRANLMMAGLGAVTVALFYVLPQFQQNTIGLSPTATSLSQLPIAVATTTTSLTASRVAGRLGPARGLCLALACLVAGLCWLTVAGPATGYVTGLLGPFLLVGVGIGGAFVLVTTLAVSGAEPEQAGLASGLVNATRQLGGALGLAVVVAVAMPSAVPSATSTVLDHSLAFATIAVLAALTLALAALALRRSGRRSTPDPSSPLAPTTSRRHTGDRHDQHPADCCPDAHNP